MIPLLRLTGIRRNVLVCIAALFLIFAIALQHRARLEEQQATPIEIAIEHQKSLDLKLTLSSRAVLQEQHPKGPGLLAIQHQGSEVIHVSIPTEWTRGEVRGTPLEQIEREEEGFGYSRWSIPPNGEVTFQLPSAPPNLLLHNASPTVLKLNFTMIDLQSGHVETTVVLVQDKPTKLW